MVHTNKSAHPNDEHCMRYALWFKTKEGKIAQLALFGLVQNLLAGWARRNRSILVMEPGLSGLVDLVWESGFEVTVQESRMATYEAVLKNKCPAVEAVLSSPEALPFDDNTFDYALVVAGLGFWANPLRALKETRRVADRGCIVLFPNSYSLFSLDARLRPKQAGFTHTPQTWLSPWAVHKLLRLAYPYRYAMRSTVHLPQWMQRGSYLQSVSSAVSPLPTGAFMGFLVDMNPVQVGVTCALCKAQPLMQPDV